MLHNMSKHELDTKENRNLLAVLNNPDTPRNEFLEARKKMIANLEAFNNANNDEGKESIFEYNPVVHAFTLVVGMGLDHNGLWRGEQIM